MHNTVYHYQRYFTTLRGKKARAQKLANVTTLYQKDDWLNRLTYKQISRTSVYFYKNCLDTATTRRICRQYMHLDFKEAFDKMSHRQNWNKQVEFSEILNGCSPLSTRRQTHTLLVFRGIRPTQGQVTSGAPNGSVLAPAVCFDQWFGLDSYLNLFTDDDGYEG